MKVNVKQTLAVAVMAGLSGLAMAEGTECRVIRTKLTYDTVDGYHYSWHRNGEERSQWIAVDGSGLNSSLAMTADEHYGPVGEGVDDESVQRETHLECRDR